MTSAATAAEAATVAVTEAVADDAATNRKAWRRVTRAWQVAFYLALAIVTLILAADHDPWYLYPVVVVIGASYTYFAVTALMNGEDDWDRYWAHLVIVTIGTVLLLWRDPGVSFLATVVLTQYSPFTGLGLRGVGAIFAVAALFGLPVGAHGGWTSDAWAGAALTTVPAFVFTVIISVFTGELIEESNRRGALIRELEETRALLDRTHHEAGVLEERERLAREIHDTLAQGFTSVLMLVQAAEASLDTDPAATRERLALAERTARENLAEARSLVGALGPVDLAGTPLDTALRRVASRTGSELHLDVRVRISGTPQDLPANVQVVLLRVAQEALANVRKHAHASGVRLDLAYGPDAVRLSARDDGVGFDPGRCLGFGLGSMRTRVEQVAGTWSLTSEPGSGTTITAEVPYR